MEAQLEGEPELQRKQANDKKSITSVITVPSAQLRQHWLLS
jgi:hypothetical protein